MNLLLASTATAIMIHSGRMIDCYQQGGVIGVFSSLICGLMRANRGVRLAVGPTPRDASQAMPS